jgi:Glycosyltransferase family 87
LASTFTLLFGLALLGLTAARIMARLGVGSPTAFLVGAFIVAHAELLVVALGLSLVRGFTPTAVLGTLGGLCLLTVLLTRGVRSGIGWRAALRPLRGDPLLIVLAVVAALGFAYTAAMGIWVPQVEDDVLTFHLVRAPLWWQHGGITYLHGIFDLRNNAYPPGGELGPLAAMTLAGNDYFVALDQLLAALALAVGAAGISRRIGFGRRQALFGGLLVLTLPLIVLQAGTAMSDLVVAAFLLAAALFLIDGSRVSPWLAGVATALAIDVKLTAPIALPFLLGLAWFARPAALRNLRLVAVVAGTAIGAFWYVVNLAETGTWDNHVSTEYSVDRGPVPVAARTMRIAIEFIDLSGASGRDRWLYGIAAMVVLAVAAVVFLRVRTRRTLVAGGIAAVVAAVPLALLPFEHRLIRAYFKFWDALGRRDLANLDSGRDLTKSASNFSWYGPLGSVLLVAAAVLVILEVRRRRLDRIALVSVIAPAYWLVAFAALLFYQDWIGRFFAFPIALAAATWGIVLRWRPVSWGVVAIAGTTLLLSLANDAKRPSGLPLLEGDKPRSVWNTPRWTGVALRDDYDAPIRYLDQHIPDSADVGLAITPSEPVYPFFGRGLERHVRFVYEQDRDAPRTVDWVFVRPDHPSSLCAAAWSVALRTTDGWRIMHRKGARTCSA